MTNEEWNDRLYWQWEGYTIDEMIDAAQNTYELNYAWLRIQLHEGRSLERRIELLFAYTTKRAELENKGV